MKLRSLVTYRSELNIESSSVVLAGKLVTIVEKETTAHNEHCFTKFEVPWLEPTANLKNGLRMRIEHILTTNRHPVIISHP